MYAKRLRAFRNLSWALGLVALLAAPVSAQDISGTWVLSVDLGPGGGGDATFVLEQEGTAVTGTYTGALGEGIELAGTSEDGEITGFMASNGRTRDVWFERQDRRRDQLH